MHDSYSRFPKDPRHFYPQPAQERERHPKDDHYRGKQDRAEWIRGTLYGLSTVCSPDTPHEQVVSMTAEMLSSLAWVRRKYSSNHFSSDYESQWSTVRLLSRWLERADLPRHSAEAILRVVRVQLPGGHPAYDSLRDVDSAVERLYLAALSHPSISAQTLGENVEWLVGGAAALRGERRRTALDLALKHRNCEAALILALCSSPSRWVRAAAAGADRCPEEGKIIAALMGL